MNVDIENPYDPATIFATRITYKKSIEDLAFFIEFSAPIKNASYRYDSLIQKEYIKRLRDKYAFVKSPASKPRNLGYIFSGTEERPQVIYLDPDVEKNVRPLILFISVIIGSLVGAVLGTIGVCIAESYHKNSTKPPLAL